MACKGFAISFCGYCPTAWSFPTAENGRLTMEPEEVNPDLPTNRRVAVYFDTTRLCFELLNLYRWILENPNKPIPHPLREETCKLTQQQIDSITREATNYLREHPEEAEEAGLTDVLEIDRLQQRYNELRMIAADRLPTEEEDRERIRIVKELEDKGFAARQAFLDDPEIRRQIKYPLFEIQQEYNKLRSYQSFRELDRFEQQELQNLIHRSLYLDPEYRIDVVYDRYIEQREKQRRDSQEELHTRMDTRRRADDHLQLEQIQQSVGRSGYKLVELKRLAESFRLPQSGSKAKLRDRLLEYYRLNRPELFEEMPEGQPTERTQAENTTLEIKQGSQTEQTQEMVIDLEKLRDSVGRSGYTLPELRNYARDLGLGRSGNKMELRDRILEYYRTNHPELLKRILG